MKPPAVVHSGVLTISDIARNSIDELLAHFMLTVETIAEDQPITGSFWGEPEAGVVGHAVYVRADTPVHSLLHEACHIICMSAERREQLNRDAGGDDLEEAAVCYLQIVLADHLPGVGRKRLMQDMDEWGYSFRAGRTDCWFHTDATDARDWLRAEKLLDEADNPLFRLR